MRFLVLVSEEIQFPFWDFIFVVMFPFSWVEYLPGNRLEYPYSSFYFHQCFLVYVGFFSGLILSLLQLTVVIDFSLVLVI